MPSDQEKVIEFFGQLASAVVHAIREGTDADRKRLVSALEEMNGGMPAVSVDSANAREFLHALIGLLTGVPQSPEGMVEPYRGIYDRILEAAMSRHAGHVHGDAHTHVDGHGDGHAHAHMDAEDADTAMKEFLTQIAASTVLVMKKGSDEDRAGLAAKLSGLLGSMPEHEKGPRSLVSAFISILKGSPVAPGTLDHPYSNIYSKVLRETGPESR
jgi:hypothetical protein